MTRSKWIVLILFAVAIGIVSGLAARRSTCLTDRSHGSFLPFSGSSCLVGSGAGNDAGTARLGPVAGPIQVERMETS